MFDMHVNIHNGDTIHINLYADSTMVHNGPVLSLMPLPWTAPRRCCTSRC
jgi:hypothetical protein